LDCRYDGKLNLASCHLGRAEKIQGERRLRGFAASYDSGKEKKIILKRTTDAHKRGGGKGGSARRKES